MNTADADGDPHAAESAGNAGCKTVGMTFPAMWNGLTVERVQVEAHRKAARE